jgi:hypothetical protein
MNGVCAIILPDQNQGLTGSRESLIHQCEGVSFLAEVDEPGHRR